MADVVEMAVLDEHLVADSGKVALRLAYARVPGPRLAKSVTAGSALEPIAVLTSPIAVPPDTKRSVNLPVQ